VTVKFLMKITGGRCLPISVFPH